MIRTEHVDVAGGEASEQPVTAVDVPQRRVDLVFRTGVTVHLEHHVMHGHLRGEAGGLGEVQTLGCRQMADVYRTAPEVRCKPVYGGPLGLGGTVPEMVPGAALHILLDQMVVLRMHAHPPAGGEDVPHGGDHLLVVIQQDVACGGTHEQLEGRDQRCEHSGVDVGRDRCEESVVHVGPAPDGRLLVHHGLDVGHGGLGVGHVQNAGDAPVSRRERPGVERLLVRHARVPEMHMRVDEAREDYPAGAHIHPLVPSGDQLSHGHDPSIRYAYLGIAELSVYEGTPLDHLLYVRINHP